MVCSCSSVASWVEVLEIVDVIDDGRVRAFLNALVQLVEHALINGVTSLSGANQLGRIVLWLPGNVFLGLSEHLTELLEALNVRLDDVELVQALKLVEHGHRTVVLVRARLRQILVPDKVDLVALRLVIWVLLQSNLLPETLDGHEDDTVLARLL